MTSSWSGERLAASPDGVDLDRPSAARVYDCYLGGSHNYAVDRETARQIVRLMPNVPRVARANRAFLRRVVEALVAAGVRQFLDIGSGIPTAGNVHEIAQRLVPDARVAYVDIDPIAVAYGRTVLAGNPQVAVVQEDLRRPGRVLSDPDLLRVLHLDEPVAILMLSLLHFVPDSDDPAAVIAHYRDAVAAGSYLAISHVERLPDPPLSGRRILAVYEQVGTPLRPRTEAELTSFFSGFELVEPGLVAVHRWRPEPADAPNGEPAADAPNGEPAADAPNGEPAAGAPDDMLTGFRAAVGRKP